MELLPPTFDHEICLVGEFVVEPTRFEIVILGLKDFVNSGTLVTNVTVSVLLAAGHGELCFTVAFKIVGW